MCCIPLRVVIALMGLSAILCSYAMRQTLSMAISLMTIPKRIDDDENDPHGCPGSVLKVDVVTYKTFEWSERAKGLLLGSFYCGYFFGHFGGRISEWYGPKHVLGTGMMLCAVLQCLIPLSCEGGAWVLAGVRVLQGVCQGCLLPSLNVLLVNWSPRSERARLGTLMYTGNFLGIVVSNILNGYILHMNGGYWPTPFYLWGLVTFVWYVLWLLLVSSSPETSRLVTERERTYLRENIGTISMGTNIRVPLRSILKSGAVWGLFFGMLGHNYGLWGIQNDLPLYMARVLKYNVKKDGLFSSLPFLLIWVCSLVTGTISDLTVNHNVMSVNLNRKLFNMIACLGPSVGCVAASYAKCDHATVNVFFNVGMAFMAFFYCSVKINILDIAPNFAGTIMAIVNGLAAIAGVTAPTIIGHMVPHNYMLEWRRVFWMLAGVQLASGVLFWLLAKTEIQPWNDLQQPPLETPVP